MSEFAAAKAPLRIHRTALLDAEPAEVPAPPSPVKRRRGRPLGSKTRVALGHVTADEFAFLRAVAEGLDLKVASRHYLLWPGREPEGKSLECFTRALLQRVVIGAQTLTETEPAARFAHELQRLRIPPVGGTVERHGEAIACHSSPRDEIQSGDLSQEAPHLSLELEPDCLRAATLENFACQFPEDMYSEAELLELYEAHKSAESNNLESLDPESVESQSGDVQGIEARADNSGSVSYLRGLLFAIDWLSDHLGVEPKREHLVLQWLRLNPSQIGVLASANLHTLGDLADWIQTRGSRWYEVIPRYGITRAGALEDWLSRWKLGPRSTVQCANPCFGLVEAKEVPNPLKPNCLNKENWPVAFMANEGKFRSALPNSLQARDDLAAVQAWLYSLRKKAAATQNSYRRSIEKLVLWAAHEKVKALSSLSADDLLEFRAFLSAPPEHWILEYGQDRRDDPAWKPLRGPLSDKSIDNAFAAICSMYALWQSSNYLSINPAEDFAAGPSRDDVNVGRSFLKQDLEVMQTAFSIMEENPDKRRLLAIFRLLESTGLRRSEVESARWGSLERCREDETISESWVLNVVDNRGRRRKLPVMSAAMQALEAHRHDRLALIESGPLKRYQDVVFANTPLISVLDGRRMSAKTRRNRLHRPEADPHEQPSNREDGQSEYHINEHGALSACAIYSELKRFFAACAEASTEPLQKSNFHKACTHWMRHSFAHNVILASDEDLPMTQQLLGHVSLNSTSRYIGGKEMRPVPVVASLGTTL
jgi:site-specific recombinase XerD